MKKKMKKKMKKDEKGDVISILTLKVDVILELLVKKSFCIRNL